MPSPQPLQTQQPATAAAYATQTNSLAWVSLITGILSWVALPVVGAIVAVVAGHVAKSQIRRTGEQGNNLATIGLILGYVHLAAVLLISAIVFIVTFAVLRTTTTTG